MFLKVLAQPESPRFLWPTSSLAWNAVSWQQCCYWYHSGSSALPGYLSHRPWLSGFVYLFEKDNHCRPLISDEARIASKGSAFPGFAAYAALGSLRTFSPPKCCEQKSESMDSSPEPSPSQHTHKHYNLSFWASLSFSGFSVFICKMKIITPISHSQAAGMQEYTRRTWHSRI